MATEYRVDDVDLPAPARKVVEWIDTYLAGKIQEQEPVLAREDRKHVCPFMPMSMHKARIAAPGSKPVLIVYDEDARDAAATEATARKYLPRFHDIPPQKGADASFKAILLIFPNLPPEHCEKAIDAVSEAVRRDAIWGFSMMVGEMHPDNATEAVKPPGSTYAGVYPNRSPVPMIALRSIVSDDWDRFLNVNLFPEEKLADPLERTLYAIENRIALRRAQLRISTAGTLAKKGVAWERDIAALLPKREALAALIEAERNEREQPSSP